MNDRPPRKQHPTRQHSNKQRRDQRHPNEGHWPRTHSTPHNPKHPAAQHSTPAKPATRHSSPRPDRVRDRHINRPASPAPSIHASPDPGADAPAVQENTQTVHGWNACWSVFTHRPGAIRRIYFGRARRQALAPVLKWAAANRLPYRELPEVELRKVSGTTHHEGVAMAVAPLRYADPKFTKPGQADGAGSSDSSSHSVDTLAIDMLAIPGSDAVWVALDDVDNPYNVGAVVRSAAFFGAAGIVAGGVAPMEKVNGAMLRASEGGAEVLTLTAAESLSDWLRECVNHGIQVIGLEADGESSWGQQPLPRPLVLVLGHERRGLSAPVRAACTAVLAIPGAGQVDSLNISVTAGIALAEAFRPRTSATEAASQHRRRKHR